MKRLDAIDLLGFAIADARQFHAGGLTGEFIIDDVRDTIKAVLSELLGRAATDAEADAVLDF